MERIRACTLLMGKPEGKRPLGRRRREDIEMVLGETGWRDEWIDQAQDRNLWRALLRFWTLPIVLSFI
jgi:hypothetical protein